MSVPCQALFCWQIRVVKCWHTVANDASNYILLMLAEPSCLVAALRGHNLPKLSILVQRCSATVCPSCFEYLMNRPEAASSLATFTLITFYRGKFRMNCKVIEMLISRHYILMRSIVLYLCRTRRRSQYILDFRHQLRE